MCICDFAQFKNNIFYGNIIVQCLSVWLKTLNLYSIRDKFKTNWIFGCDSISKVCLDINDDLLEDLYERANLNQSRYEDLIVEYIKKGLNEVDNMSNITLNENVMEKVNIMARLTEKTPEEVVNDTLWENLENIVDIPDELDYDAIWNMLEHDKPEGDNVLDNLARYGEEGWD